MTLLKLDELKFRLFIVIGNFWMFLEEKFIAFIILNYNEDNKIFNNIIKNLCIYLIT